MFMNLIGLAAALLQPEPLDPDLACIVDRITPAQRGAIVQEADSGRAGPIRDALNQAAATCGRQRSWPPAFQNTVLRLAGSLILAEEAAAMLERQGIDPERIQRWYDSQTADFRARGEISPADGERLVQQLTAEGTAPLTVERNANLIGVLVGALAVIGSTAPSQGN